MSLDSTDGFVWTGVFAASRAIQRQVFEQPGEHRRESAWSAADLVVRDISWA